MKGIFLDEPIRNALIARAWYEEEIESYTNGEAPYEKNFLNEHLSTPNWKYALQELVLREKLYIGPDFDNFIIDSLEDEGAIEVVSPIDIDTTEKSDPGHIKFSSEEFLNEGLHFPAVKYAQYAGIDISIERLYNLLQQEVFDDFTNRLVEAYKEESGKLIDSYDPETGDVDTDYDSQVEELTSFQGPLFNVLKQVKRLKEYCSALNVPVLWDLEPPRTINQEHQLNSKTPDDIEYIASGIYFEDLKTIRVHSVRDALKLRTETKIDDFRTEVIDAMEGVKNRELTPQEVKRRVKNANRALERADQAGKTGTILTFTPILAPPELSPYITFLGIGSVVYKLALQEKYSWAFISRR